MKSKRRTPCLYSGLNFASREGDADDMSSLSVIVHAVVGMYNANLVARLNGISESVQVETSIPVKLVDDGLDD